jgi:hypothetical protein
MPFDQSFKSLIQGMLSVNPIERWTIDEILGCEWLSEGETVTPSEALELMKSRVQ